LARGRMLGTRMDMERRAAGRGARRAHRHSQGNREGRLSFRPGRRGAISEEAPFPAALAGSGKAFPVAHQR
jgi:hypothetical protein